MICDLIEWQLMLIQRAYLQGSFNNVSARTKDVLKCTSGYLYSVFNPPCSLIPCIKWHLLSPVSLLSYKTSVTS